MGSIEDFSGPSMDLNSCNSSDDSLPLLTSMYLWDACKKGKLFQTEIYQKQLFITFVDHFSFNVVKHTIIPTRFNPTKVYQKWVEVTSSKFEESEIGKSIESVDAKEPESIENLASESKVKSEQQIIDVMEFLKNDIFPQTLWMEFSRVNDSYSEAMDVLIERLEKMVLFKPKRKDSIKRRNRFVQTLFGPFVSLSDNLLTVFFNFKRIYLFMELLSCKDESELFTEKLWTFNHKNYTEFEKVIFDFHNSITSLEQNLYLLNPPKEDLELDFSKPVGWAFKQLVQTVSV